MKYTRCLLENEFTSWQEYHKNALIAYGINNMHTSTNALSRIHAHKYDTWDLSIICVVR